MIANRYGVSFWVDENIPKLTVMVCTTLNILKNTEVFTQINGRTVWNVNYISIKLLPKINTYEIIARKTGK